MKRNMVLRVFAAAVVGTAGLCVPSTVASAGVQNGGCKVTGGGTQQVGATLTVSAKGDQTSAPGSDAYSGNVTLTTPAGDEYHFNVTFLFCGHDGGGGPGAPNDPSPGDANIANFEGVGTRNGVAGYDYAVTLHDHGEGEGYIRNPDEFAITVEQTSDGTILEHWAGLITEGNFQVQT